MKRDEKKLRDIRKAFESLFGDIGEIDVLEADGLLQSVGIDYDSVRRRLYQKLTESAASFRLKGEAVPRELQQALSNFRPFDAPPRNQEEAQRQARGILGKLLEHMPQQTESPRFAFSYRARGDLTERDVKLLDSVVSRLKERLGQKE